MGWNVAYCGMVFRDSVFTVMSRPSSASFCHGTSRHELK
jgi:hypothetical protein